MAKGIIYGYCVVNGSIAIREDERKVIRDIFNMYLSGESLLKIAEKLVADGIVNSQGDISWDKNRVGRILKNRKYIGEDGYLPIVDEKIFEMCLSKRKAKADNYVCTQLLKELEVPVLCEKCNSKMLHRHYSRRQNADYWVCNSCEKSIRLDDDELLKRASIVTNFLMDNSDQLLTEMEKEQVYTDEVYKMQRRIDSAFISMPEDIELIKEDIRNLASAKYDEVSSFNYETYKIASFLKGSKTKALSTIEIINEIGLSIVLRNKDDVWIVLLNGLMAGEEYKRGSESNTYREKDSNSNSSNSRFIKIEKRSA